MSLKIGVIFCAYQTEDLLPMSLTPWVEARRERLGGHEFKICAVSVPFEGFDHGGEPMDKTRTILGTAAEHDEIDHAIVTDKPMKEIEARGAALSWLVAQGVTHLWQVDSDEEYTSQDISRIASIVESNPFMAWWSLSFKNLVFTPNQWLADPFTPPRIHKVNLNRFRASGFWADNNIFYVATDDGERLQDIKWAAFTIPSNTAWIKHHTWLNNERGRKKQKYQQLRWGPPNGAGCSFAWDEARGGLVWNEEYFRLTGQPIPEIIPII